MTDFEPVTLKANRIVVTLDTSARGRAALEAAVRLAANTSAELQGLFVEDEDLVRLAALPFAREVDSVSASARELHSIKMEQDLRQAAKGVQKAFANTLQQLNLKWTFRVVRGAVTQASLAAGVDVDLLIIGQQGRSPRIIASDFLPRPLGDRHQNVAVFDGSPSAYRTLEFASRLGVANSVLRVIVLASNGEELTHQCMSWLREHHIQAEVDQVKRPSQDAIVDLVRIWPPTVLLINRDSQFVSDSQINRLVNEFDCPIILT